MSGAFPDFSSILSRERILALAGERSFSRGEDYYRRGAVNDLGLADNGGGISAVVAGSKEYRVELLPDLRGQDGAFAWSCSCPVGQKKLFCKHLVAVAFACFEKNDGKEAVEATLNDTRRLSAQADADKPVFPLLEAVQGSQTDFCSMENDADPAAQPLLPLYHLQDFVLCPRLFYLSWVEHLFTGKSIGKSTGKPAGHAGSGHINPDAPPPRPMPENVRFRSRHLENAALGLAGYVATIEDADGLHCLLHNQKAPPRFSRDWEPERARLTAAAMLLVAAGFTVSPQAFIYEVGEKKPLVVTLDDALFARTRTAIAVARATAAKQKIPPPLVDDARCLACVAYPVCLPRESLWRQRRARTGRGVKRPAVLPGFEVAFAAEPAIETVAETVAEAPPDLSRQPPRPPETAGEILVAQTPGAVIGQRGGEFVVSFQGEILGRLPRRQTRAIYIYGAVQITAQAVQSALEEEIDVAYFAASGRFLGLLRGLPASGVDARLGQYRFFQHPFIRLRLAGEVVRAKIHNQRVQLMRAGRADKSVINDLARLRAAAEAAGSLDELRGLEGAAARLYFGAFAAMLKEGAAAAFDFSGRNRRPPQDPVNALLSLGYSMLAKELTGVCHAVGLDPFLGFYHQPRYGRPALALDLMEEFRPLIADSVAVSMINRGEIDEDDFLRWSGGVWLNEAGRRAFWPAWFRRLNTEVSHPEFKYKMSYRRIFEAQARQLWRFARGDADGYFAFTTR